MMEPIFARDDPDDELFECSEPDCEALVPIAGPDGWARHMLARHPETSHARSIFARLIEVQLMRADDAAEVVQ